MSINREQLKSHRKIFDKHIKSLDGTIKFREISAAQRVEISELFNNKDSVSEQQLAAAQLIVLTVVDDKLKPLYSKATEVMDELDGPLFDQMAMAAMEACSFTDKEKGKTEKKSKPRRKSSSRSNSV